jgi:hypothetical protein
MWVGGHAARPAHRPLLDGRWPSFHSEFPAWRSARHVPQRSVLEFSICIIAPLPYPSTTLRRHLVRPPAISPFRVQGFQIVHELLVCPHIYPRIVPNHSESRSST